MRQRSASRRAEGREVHQNRHEKHAGEARGQARRLTQISLNYCGGRLDKPVEFDFSISGFVLHTAVENCTADSFLQGSIAAAIDRAYGSPSG